MRDWIHSKINHPSKQTSAEVTSSASPDTPTTSECWVVSVIKWYNPVRYEVIIQKCTVLSAPAPGDGGGSNDPSPGGDVNCQDQFIPTDDCPGGGDDSCPPPYICGGGGGGNPTSNKDCAGVEGGSAYIDDCGVCVGGTTGKVACEPCNITTDELGDIFPNASLETRNKLLEMIGKYGDKFELDNKYAVQQLLAQVNVETGGLTDMSENISRETANTNYGGFYGNTDNGDGYKYRGRGILQLTFKGAYKNFTAYYDSHFDSNLDFVENPGLLASNLKIAVISGLWYFKYRVMSDVDISSQTTSKEITKQINPGARPDDIANRKKKFDKVKKSITCQ